MTHDLATANRHDHAWIENWAQYICTLRTPLSPMRPWYAHRQGDRGGHLYGTEGTSINCPTCFPLLNVGFMTILRRTDYFILIWTCGAVLTDHRQRSFSKLSRFQNETHKNKKVVLFAAMLCLETMSVELHGRSHPAHNAARMVYHTDHRPCGCQGIKSCRVPQRGMVSKISMSKAIKYSPSPRASGFSARFMASKV